MAAFVHRVLESSAAMVEGPALAEGLHPETTRHRARHPVRRTSHVARGQRVSGLAVRGSDHPDVGRRRRMDDDDTGLWPWLGHPVDPRDSFPSFARIFLQRDPALPWLRS